MNAIGWAAPSVRARNMARRRLGRLDAHRLAEARSLTEAVSLLTGTAYGERVHPTMTLAAAQRAVADTLLWQVRVLAGWSPPGGTAWARTLLAGFERDNIVEHLRAMTTGAPAPRPPFALGALATAWPRLAATSTPSALLRELRRSAWTDPGTTDPAQARDVLTAVWLRRLADTLPQTRDWARTAALLLVARTVIVAGRRLPERATPAIGGLLGQLVFAARTLDELRAAVPARVGRAVAEVQTPERLWQAEAALVDRIDREGCGLLRALLPGPDQPIGASAVLAVDAWRVRAALASAAAGAPTGEAADGVA